MSDDPAAAGWEALADAGFPAPVGPLGAAQGQGAWPSAC